MNLNRIITIYDIIKDRIPKTYPRPKLGFFEDEQSLSQNMRVKIEKGHNLYAVCDPTTMTVAMPMNMKFIYTTVRGKDVSKITPLNKMDDEEIAQTLLHEIAHLYFGQRYGYHSKQYHDEVGCDRFANRWVRVLKRERLI